MAFKFDDACGQRQLSFLTEAQRAAWRASRALVRIGGAERPDNQPRLKELMRRLDANLARLCASASVPIMRSSRRRFAPKWPSSPAKR